MGAWNQWNHIELVDQHVLIPWLSCLHTIFPVQWGSHVLCPCTFLSPHCLSCPDAMPCGHLVITFSISLCNFCSYDSIHTGYNSEGYYRCKNTSILFWFYDSQYWFFTYPPYIFYIPLLILCYLSIYPFIIYQLLHISICPFLHLPIFISSINSVFLLLIFLCLHSSMYFISQLLSSHVSICQCP